MDEIEENLKRYFLRNVDVPIKCSNALKTALYSEKRKKFFIQNRVMKLVTVSSICIIMTTGVIFAKDISKIVKNIFNISEGMESAIENGYIEKVDMKYINSNGTSIKANYVLMDDFNLSLEFSAKLGENVDKNNIEKIEFSKMIITDEENKIIYCEDKEMFEDYCKINNLNYKWRETNENYMNNGINFYTKPDEGKLKYEGIINIIYNLYANGYPKSKKLCINIQEIKLILNEKAEDKEIGIAGDWKMEIEVPEQFYNRENIIYKVKSISDSSIIVTEAVVYNTCMKFEIITKEEPLYNEDEDEEVKQKKREEKIKEWISEFEELIEQGENPSKLNLFSDNAYVENSDGKIFTPTKSSSEDSGYIRAFTGDIRYWQTFNLTKYDAANQIKVYINYKGKDITIELER